MAVINHIKNNNGRSLVNSRILVLLLLVVAVVCGSLVASVHAGFGITATPVTTTKKDSSTRLLFSSYLDSLSAASAANAAANYNNYNNGDSNSNINNGYNMGQQQQQQQPQQVESTQQYLQQLQQLQTQTPQYSQYSTPAPSTTAAAASPPSNPALSAAATYQQYAATPPSFNANNNWNRAVASTAVVPPPSPPTATPTPTPTTTITPPQTFSQPQAQVPTETTPKASSTAKTATPPNKPAVEIDEQAIKASRLQKDSIEIKSAARDSSSVEDSLQSNQMGTALEFLAVASLYVGIPFFLDSNWPQIQQQFNNLVTTSNQVEGEAEQILENTIKRNLKTLFTPMQQAPPKPSTMIQQGAAQLATGWGAFLERNTLKTTPQMDVDAVRGRLLMTDYYKNKQAALDASTAATTAAAVVVVEIPAAPTVPDTSTPPVVPPEPAASGSSILDDAATTDATAPVGAVSDEASVTAPSTLLPVPEAPVESVNAAPITESVQSNPPESTAPVEAATQMPEPVVVAGEENNVAAGTAAAAAAAAQAEPVSFTPTTTVATANDYYYYYNPVDPTTAPSHFDVVAPTMLQEQEVAAPLSFEEDYLAQEGQRMSMPPTEFLVDDTGVATYYDAGVAAEQSPVTSSTSTLGYYDASFF